MIVRRRLRPTRPRSAIAIDQALADRNLLGAALGSPATWARWSSVLRAAFALRMNDTDCKLFAEVAGARSPPSHRVNELWAVVGRRSGKTRMAAACACFIGAIEKHTLAPGEVGYVLLLAASRSQASVAFSYVRGFLESSPILRQLIETVTAHEVRLRNGVIISVHASSYRTIRGRTLLGVVGDETSFWRDETSAQPDTEIYRACVPALAATGGMWIGISTGYRKVGLLFQKYRDHFGQDDDSVLVIQGPTSAFNTSLDQAVIARAQAADPEAAESEWGGGFRSDISAFLDDATIDAAIDHSRPLELPPRTGLSYYAFSDASGGRKDHFTVCVGHTEDGRMVCDAIRGRAPPFDPQSVVSEYSALLKQYGLNRVAGDNYSAEWVQSAWRDAGIEYTRSEQPKSALYLESLPAWMRGAVSIPDHSRLIRELRLLERRTSRVGKDVVDHGKSGSDDYANALCGLLYGLSGHSLAYDTSMKWVSGPGDGARIATIQRRSSAMDMLRHFGLPL